MGLDTVTRHIANVESWIGTPLFLRHGSKVELTREGQRLSDLATAAFDRLELGVRGILPTNKDEFVVGASFGVAHLWVMPRISGMRAASGKNINLVTSDDYRIFDEPGVDFSIRFGHGDFGENCADHLFDEQCRIIAAPSFLTAPPPTRPQGSAAITRPWAHAGSWRPQWHWLDGLGALSVANRWRISWQASVAHRAKLPDNARHGLCAGEGISIGTIGIEDDLIASGKLVCIGPPVSRPGLWILSRL